MMATENWQWRGIVTNVFLVILTVFATIYIPQYVSDTKLVVSLNHIDKPRIDTSSATQEGVMSSIAAVEKEFGTVGLKHFAAELIDGQHRKIVSVRIVNKDSKRSREVEVNPSLSEGAHVLLSLNGKPASFYKLTDTGLIKLGVLDPNDEYQLTYFTSGWDIEGTIQVLHDGQRLMANSNNLQDRYDPFGLVRFHYNNIFLIFMISSSIAILAFFAFLKSLESWYHRTKTRPKID